MAAEQQRWCIRPDGRQAPRKHPIGRLRIVSGWRALRSRAPSREAIGLDVGGSKIAGYRVDADGTVLDHVREPTPTSGPERILRAIEAVANKTIM